MWLFLFLFGWIQIGFGQNGETTNGGSNSTLESTLHHPINLTTPLINRSISLGNSTVNKGIPILTNVKSAGISTARLAVNSSISLLNSTLQGAARLAQTTIGVVNGVVGRIPVIGPALQRGGNITSSILGSLARFGSSVLSSVQTLKNQKLNFLNNTLSRGSGALTGFNTSMGNFLSKGVTAGSSGTNLVGSTTSVINRFFNSLGRIFSGQLTRSSQSIH